MFKELTSVWQLDWAFWPIACSLRLIPHPFQSKECRFWFGFWFFFSFPKRSHCLCSPVLDLHLRCSSSKYCLLRKHFKAPGPAPRVMQVKHMQQHSSAAACPCAVNLMLYTEMDLLCIYAGKNSCCSSPPEGSQEDRYVAAAGHAQPKAHRLHTTCIKKKKDVASCDEVILRKYCSLCSVHHTS